MAVHYFFSAVLLGIIVAIPPGSVTIIAGQRALQYGFKNSFIFTCGSCLSDIFYISLVYWGLAAYISSNMNYKLFLWVICGILLITIGITTIRSAKNSMGRADTVNGLQSKPMITFISGIIITLTNPLTIVGWIAIAGNHFLLWNETFPESRHYGPMVIVFIMVGVLIWFVPLIYFISALKRFITAPLLRYFIYASGICLIAFGLVSLYWAVRTGLMLS